MIDQLKAIVDNLPFFFHLATVVVGFASGIAALTPTPKDDGVLLKVKKVLAVLSLNVLGSKALSDTKPAE